MASQTKPKISIVIPAHNEQQYIGKTLQSFNNQSYPPFEIIVVCDSCTDQTESIAKQYGAKTIKVKHRNISSSRNSGFTMTSGEIIIFQDADSVPSLNYLENIALAYEKGIDYGSAKLIPESDHLLNIFRLDVMNLLSRLIGVFYGSSLFVSRKLLEKVGKYDPHIPWAEDVDIANRLRSIGKAKWKLLRYSYVKYSERKFIKNGYVKEIWERTWKLTDYYNYKMEQKEKYKVKHL